MAPTWHRKLWEACCKYFVSIFGTTTDENVLLKSDFLCEMPMASFEVIFICVAIYGMQDIIAECVILL